MAGGVEYQVTKVDPTDPETKGMVHQVHKVSEEIAATIGGKVYRARIINDPTAPTVAGKVYQIVLIDDPDDPSVKGMVYNAILTGGSEAVVVGPAVSPLSLPDAVADSLAYVKAFGGTGQESGTPTPTTPKAIICNNGTLKVSRPSGLPAGYTLLSSITNANGGYLDTGFTADVDDMEFDIVATVNDSAQISWYIFQSRAGGGSPIYGISGSQSGNSFIGSFSGVNNSIPYTTVSRTAGHTYHINCVCKNGTNTLTVEDLTTGDVYTSTATYTFAAAATNIGLFSNLNGGSVSNGNTSVASAYLKKNGEKVLDYVPVLDPNGNVGFYDKVTDSFLAATGGSFVAGPNAADPITIVTDGTQETITTKADGAVISTATCENLLGLGDYTDEQEIISGQVTRKVGIHVCDGTETLIATGDSYGVAFDIRGVPFEPNAGALCTHLAYSSSASTSQENVICNRTGNYGLRMLFNSTIITNVNTKVVDATAYLAAQYAAGTPVIVIYPLATATTESVAGQTLQVQDGDNTLEITQASLTGLELEAGYEAVVLLTVQEAEDADLDDNVAVTIE